MASFPPIPAGFLPSQAAALRSTVNALGAEQRAALPSIQRAVRTGIGADRIFQALRGTTGTIPRAAVRSIVGAFREAEQDVADLRFLRRDRRPNPDRLPQALTTIRRNFSFTVRGSLITPDGETVQQNISVATDSILTRGEIEAFAHDALETGVYGAVLEVTNVQLVSGLRAGPAGTVF